MRLALFCSPSRPLRSSFVLKEESLAVLNPGCVRPVRKEESPRVVVGLSGCTQRECSSLKLLYKYRRYAIAPLRCQVTRKATAELAMHAGCGSRVL
jgi:hypothetical protein